MDKNWWKSKTIWAGILSIAAAALAAWNAGGITPEVKTLFIAGLGLIGIRDAIGNLME